MTLRALPLLAFAPLACASESLPPKGQILLYVTTDAPLPASGNEDTSSDDAPPLFDTVRIDLLERDGSTCCTKESPVDRRMVDEGRASVGVIPPVGATGYAARVRLFRASVRLEDEPPFDATLDVTARLPSIEAEGIAHVTVRLLVDTLGTRVGDPEPIEPELGRPPRSLVGSWPGARRVPCNAPPAAGEVCVPGGAYWMGNPRVGNELYEPGRESDRQRLVVLSPFYLDATEVTVAAMRLYVEDGGSFFGGTWDDATYDSLDDWCPWTPLPGQFEGFPMSCLIWESARDYCAWRGARLPTEAELEYVAGGLESALYIWGDDEPTCADAVFARGGVGVLNTARGDCRPPGTSGGAMPPGSGIRDRLDLPTGTVYDVAGNVPEMILDNWNRQDEPCWSRSGIYVNPRCDGESVDGSMHRNVGGPWLSAPAQMRAAYRGTPDSHFFSGFRCARPVSSDAEGGTP